MNWCNRLMLCWVFEAAVFGATIACADGVPSTRYMFDNNGNLHGSEVTAFDAACNQFVTTPDACGSCSNKCPNTGFARTCTVVCGQASCTGVCGVTCPSPLTACALACVNLDFDVTHCGACNRKCLPFPNAIPRCFEETCIRGPCIAGWGNCDGIDSNGCEHSTATDVNNCGACGNKCSLPNAAAVCSTGQCAVSGCASGYLNCDGSSANGCEAAADAQNCGACGKSCSTGQRCYNGACCTPKTACPAGYYCGSIDDGCGGTISCGRCSGTGRKCISDDGSWYYAGYTCSASHTCVARACPY
jgi:hypothetical protein